MKILLVEDEPLLSGVIAKGLRKLSYAVDCAFDGEQALENIALNEYDLIVLDLNLPKFDGIEVLRQVRKMDSETKILILSARTEIDDRVLGLDRGANDYLTKPFDFLELEARMRALLRRNFVQDQAVLTCGRLVVDTSKKTVLVDGAILELTKKEYAIIEYLVIHCGKVISAESLIEHVWDSDVDLFSNSLKFHMSSLRKKIGNPEFIKTLRGQGYLLADS